MKESDSIRLFKCLSDKSRLQILKSLAIEDMIAEKLLARDTTGYWRVKPE